MNSDVFAVTVTSDGVAYAGPARVKAIAFVCGSTGGSTVLTDNGASGTEKLDLATPEAAGFHYMNLPVNGLRFETNVHVTVGDATSVTLFMG